MIIATAGHIDHGKTALVRALTGVDTDRLAEEKRRGMTIDLGFAYRPLANGAVLGFVDVPGHERFVRTMLAGVAGVDFALIAVAADDGVMPQTVEHVDILDLLGIADGAVALTKADLVDGARLDEVAAEVRALLAPTALAGLSVFPVSAVSGEGIGALRRHLEDTAAAHCARATAGHFRLAVDRAFTLGGVGLVVTGTAYSGQTTVGDELVLSPAGIAVRVRGLHVHNHEATVAAAGARCAVNIAGAGLSREQVRRGDWLVGAGVHAPTERLDARLLVAAGEARVLANWTPVHVHLGADDVPARVAVLEAASIAPGKDGLVRLALDRPIGALAGDRFILRDQSARRTIAGGRVIDPFPPPRGRSRPERLAALAALEAEDHATALAGLLAVSPAGVDLKAFAQARNLAAAEADAVIAGVPMVRHGGSALGQEHEAALRERIVAALDRFHREQLDRLGPDRATLRRVIGGGLAAELVAGTIDRLVADGALATRGPLVHLARHQPRLQPGDEAVWQTVEPVLRAAGVAPPVVHEIAKEIGAAPDVIARALRRAEAIGLVVRIGRNRFATPDIVALLSDAARKLARQDGLTPAAFRGEAGIGRNLAIEVLEHFDRVGLTRRVGDRRMLVEPSVAHGGAP